MNKKIVLIGWDGATWDVLNSFIKKGIMPNLKKRLEESSSGILNSCIPPITAPAWASIMTGKNPGNHNIYEFFNTDDIWKNNINSSNSILSQTIWDILSEKGYKHILSGIPLLFPFKNIKGIQIADFLIPQKESLSIPADILSVIEKKFGTYRLWPKEVFFPGNEEKILDECLDFIEYHYQVQNFLFENYEWDIFFYYHNILDRFQHELWHLIDNTHPFYNEKLTSKLKSKINLFFQTLDKTIDINKINSYPLILLSDHGFGPNKYYFSVNHQLLKKKLIQLKNKPLIYLKKLFYHLGFTPLNIYDLISFIGLSKFRLSRYRGKLGTSFFDKISKLIFINSRDIEQKKSLFFAKGNYGQIYCLKKEYDIKKMKQVLLNCFSEYEHLIHDIKHKNEIYHGKFLKNAPDFTIILNDYSYNLNSPADFMKNKTISKISSHFMPGAHRKEGIYLIHSTDVKKNHHQQAEITDISPTVLYLLSEFSSSYSFDGKPLKSIFYDEKPETEQISQNKDKTNKNPDNGKNNNEILLQRLKSLGYI